MRKQVEQQAVHQNQQYGLEIYANKDQTKNQRIINQYKYKSSSTKFLHSMKDSAINKKLSEQKYTELDKIKRKAKNIQDIDEHKIPVEQLCHRLGTNLQRGLSTDMAIKRNREQGDNAFDKFPPAWLIFLRRISNWISLILLIASILSILIYTMQPDGNLHNLYLGIVLICLAIVNCLVVFILRKPKPDQTSGFNNMFPLQARVMRDGNITRISASKLVRGDVVEIMCGNKIPADIRIISSNQMKTDNLSLTGESQPILITTKCTNEDPLTTRNLVFFGTHCKEGRGRGIVIRTGENVLMATISNSVTQIFLEFPVMAQLERLTLIIGLTSIFLGIFFFLFAFFVLKYEATQCMIISVGILVASVPQGLFICIAFSLVITAKKLFKKKVLIKSFQAIETLGRISCIISDKTGIITENNLRIQNLWYNGSVKKGDNKQLKGDDFEYEYQVNDPSFKALHHAAMICCQAKFDVSEQQIIVPGFKYNQMQVIGDASDAALLKFYQPIQSILKTRAMYKFGKNQDRSDAKVRYNSSNKYSLSIVQQEGPDHHWVVYIKGAPEIIWKYSGRIFQQGKYRQIDSEQKQKFNEANLKFIKNGERVHGFAMLPLNKEQFSSDFTFVTSWPDKFNFPMKDFVFLGLISLVDPPKESVPLAIEKCKSAGIKVIMTTGDSISIALAIAKQVGIITTKTNQDLKQEGYFAQDALNKANAVVISGDMISNILDNRQQKGMQILANWCNKPQLVFARTMHAQKLNIVTACQNIGHICTASDDGYFCPTLRQADIGISNGICSSDISKEASDIILLNSEFGLIIEGIEEARKCFENQKKMIVYLFTANMAEILPFASLVILQVPLPLSNILLLCICVGTDIYPALSIIFQQGEADIMTRKPRKRSEKLISAKLLTHSYANLGCFTAAGAFFSYFVVMNLYGFDYNVIFGLVSQKALVPNNDMLYNTPYNFEINSANYGNPQLPANCRNAVFKTGFPNWISDINSAYDLRASYVTCNSETGTYNLLFNRDFYTRQVLNTVSPITNQPVAWTTECVFYAQSAYFATIVMIQWSNLFACKSRKSSFIYSSFNFHMLGGILLETIVVIFLLYVPGVNKVFGGRPLQFFLLGIPGLGFSIILLVWEQLIKFLMNLDRNNGEPKQWQRNSFW